MISYDLTIEKVLRSVQKYLLFALKRAKTQEEKEKIKANIASIGKIKSNPIQFSNYEYRVKNAPITMDGFVRAGSSDKQAYFKFTRLLAAIGRFYENTGDKEKRKKLLLAIENWHHAISRNPFKGFCRDVLPSKRFAVKIDKQR